MKINTKHFGTVDIEEQDIILFEDGIPGIVGSKRYAMLINSEEESPFFWIQSVDDENVALALINPVTFYPDYAPKVEKEIIQKLGEPKEENLIVCSIVVIPEDITKMTVNLKAPLVINRDTELGMQVIVENEDYHIRHNLYEQIIRRNEQEVGE